MPSLLLVMSIHNTDGTFCTVNLPLHSQRMHQIILKNLRHIMLKFTREIIERVRAGEIGRLELVEI